MNNNIKWNLRKLGDKRVRIELGQFSRMPSAEEYEDYIRTLLGINSLEKLNDENNPDFGDSILLRSELEKTSYREVVFSGPDGDVLVNAQNIDETFRTLGDAGKNNNKEVRSVQDIGEQYTK